MDGCCCPEQSEGPDHILRAILQRPSHDARASPCHPPTVLWKLRRCTVAEPVFNAAELRRHCPLILIDASVDQADALNASDSGA
jgi:hypothetical protein